MRAATVVAAEGHWLIPGLVDGHAHGYATLMRGTENSLPLELWAFYTVLYGRAFDEATMCAAILLGAAERIRAGITGWIDHSPMVHLSEAALAAHEASGLRVGYAVFLHDVADDALLELAVPEPVASLAGGVPSLDPQRYAAHFAELMETARAGSGRVSVLLGPNAPQRCSPAAWQLWRSLREAHGVGVHTHLMETRTQAGIGQRGWPGGLVAEMERQRLLGEWLSVAHGVWLAPAERDLLAAHRVTVVHNPASNLMLGSGIMPLHDARRAGLRVALGTELGQHGRTSRSVRGYATGADAAAGRRSGSRALAAWPRRTRDGDAQWRRRPPAGEPIGTDRPWATGGPRAGAMPHRRDSCARCGRGRAGAAWRAGGGRFGDGRRTLGHAWADAARF